MFRLFLIEINANLIYNKTRTMNPLVAYFTNSSLKKNFPQLRPGDTVRVHQRIKEGNKSRIQVFEGLVIAVRGGTAINSSFVVRYVHKGTRVGVEKTFPLHSPNVEKVERLKSSKVRQARLFYMRNRFGRAGRMKGEAKNMGDWVETTKPAVIESPAEEPTDNKQVTKEPEVTAVVDQQQVSATELAPLEEEVKQESAVTQ